MSLPIADNRFLSSILSAFQISLGPSPFTWTNFLNQRVEVIISGGTITAVNIIRGGTSIPTGLLSGIFILDPTDSIQITYTVAPAVWVIPL